MSMPLHGLQKLRTNAELLHCEELLQVKSSAAVIFGVLKNYHNGTFELLKRLYH
jgi:hypothetical protein